MKNERSLIAALLASAALSLPAMAQQAANKASTDIGQIGVQGTGDAAAPAAGYIIPDDSPKQRSTVTKEAIEQQPQSNFYQLMSRQAGVNAFSNDATGLFGGALSIRGFNSDEIGVTVAGVPVNDSGNFAVFPQEYVDPENLQEIDITQGAPDADQPQAGSVGGAISLVMQDPKDKFGVKLVQSGGQLGFFKSFLRIDTGDIAGTGIKAFLSYSKAQTYLFNSPGYLDRDHVDASVVWESGGGSKYTYVSMFNTALNNNYPTVTQKQWATIGRNFSFEPVLYGNPSVNTTVPAGALSVNPGQTYQQRNYYGYNVNPFDDYITSFTADMALTEQVHLKVQPYYWDGYGTGGSTFGTLSEATGITAANNPAVKIPTDLNGNGTKTDTVGFYNGSFTSTNRPGVNTTITYQPIDWDIVRFGLDYDHARHHQTKPFEFLNADGTVPQYFLNEAPVVTRPDGTIVQGREQTTFTDTKIAFFENQASFFNDTLKVVAGIKRQEVNRDGHNLLPSALATNNPLVTNPQRNDVNWLPEIQADYHITPEVQVFSSLQKTARVPSNFSLYYGSATSLNLEQIGAIAAQNPETAWDLDIGARYQDDVVIGSVDLYGNNFSNRLFSVVLPDTTSLNLNAGTVHGRGIEAEVGTAKPFYDFSLFQSFTFAKSTLQSDVAENGCTIVASPCPAANQAKAFIPTTGKVYPNTPRWMAATVIDYLPHYIPGLVIGLTPKYTGSRYATLVNDEKIPGFLAMDLTVTYHLPDEWQGPLHNTQLQFAVQNLTDRDYRFFGLSSSSQQVNAQNLKINGVNVTGIAPTYNIGAPRFLSVKLTAEF